MNFSFSLSLSLASFNFCSKRQLLHLHSMKTCCKLYGKNNVGGLEVHQRIFKRPTTIRNKFKARSEIFTSFRHLVRKQVKKASLNSSGRFTLDSAIHLHNVMRWVCIICWNKQWRWIMLSSRERSNNMKRPIWIALFFGWRRAWEIKEWSDVPPNNGETIHLWNGLIEERHSCC